MADASWGVGKSGEKEDPSLVFTRQMAALYRRQAWPGRDVVLDMNYTDIGKTYRIVLGEGGRPRWRRTPPQALPRIAPRRSTRL